MPPAGFPGPDEQTRSRRYLTSLVHGTADEPPVVDRLVLPPATSWEPGTLVCQTVLSELTTLTSGIVFGGYIACLVDHFAGLVMMTVLPDDAAFLTAGMQVSFRVPLRPGAARIEARVNTLARRHATVEVTFDQDGRVTGTGTVEQIIRCGVRARLATAANGGGG